MSDRTPTRDGRRVTDAPPSPDHPGTMERRDARRAEEAGETAFTGGLDTQGPTGTETAIVSDESPIALEEERRDPA